MTREEQAKVAVVMGSVSDRAASVECKKYFDHFGIPFDEFVFSAHRTPRETANFAENAERHGYKVIIAIAGMAAHLPGAVAAYTTLPVIGVPMPNSSLQGEDALYSIVQMPKGVPVAAVAIGTAGAANAAILAAQILGLEDEKLKVKLREFKKNGCKI
ncbi:MAG: 5-(carboxyamino)imidazole ribonucleotide mutase [bacterium]